jgi:hypothetical protein
VPVSVPWAGSGPGGGGAAGAPWARAAEPPSAPEASSLRCALSVSSRSFSATWVIWRAVSEASIFSIFVSRFLTLSRCFFFFAFSDSCLSRAVRARVARASACRSPLVSRSTTAASRPAARSSSRAWSAAFSGCGVSSVSRKVYVESWVWPWYCWRASRPASSRLAARSVRVRARSAVSSRVFARWRRSFSSVALYASVASSAFRYSVLSWVSSPATDRSAGRVDGWAGAAVAAGTGGMSAAAAVIAAAQTEPTIRPDTGSHLRLLGLGPTTTSAGTRRDSRIFGRLMGESAQYGHPSGGEPSLQEGDHGHFGPLPGLPSGSYSYRHPRISPSRRDMPAGTRR